MRCTTRLQIVANPDRSWLLAPVSRAAEQLAGHLTARISRCGMHRGPPVLVSLVAIHVHTGLVAAHVVALVDIPCICCILRIAVCARPHSARFVAARCIGISMPFVVIRLWSPTTTTYVMLARLVVCRRTRVAQSFLTNFPGSCLAASYANDQPLPSPGSDQLH